MHLAALHGYFTAIQTLITRALEGPAKDMDDHFFDDRNDDWQEIPLHLAVGRLSKRLTEKGGGQQGSDWSAI